jgi:hypothetical protein
LLLASVAMTVACGAGQLAGATVALAVAVGSNVNLSAALGNQVEGAIAADPHNS